MSGRSEPKNMSHIFACSISRVRRDDGRIIYNVCFHNFGHLFVLGLFCVVYGVAAIHYNKCMVVYKLPGELGMLSVCHDLIVHYVPVCEMFSQYSCNIVRSLTC